MTKKKKNTKWVYIFKLKKKKGLVETKRKKKVTY